MNRCCITFIIWLSLWSVSLGGQRVVILIDDSSSMRTLMQGSFRERRIDAAKKALGYVMMQLPEDAHVGVYALNKGWTIPFGPVDQNQLHQALADLNAQGSTPLGAAMKVATDALLKAREQQTYGSYRLVIVSDGEATDGNLVRSYLPDIQQRGITIDVIGVSMDRKHSLATEVDRYREANDHDALVQAMEESLAEMSDDNQDTDEAADFSLLQGLPDDVTVALIDTLSRPNNEPISKSRADAKPKVFLPRPRPSPSRKPNDVPKEMSPEGAVALLIMLIVIFGLLAVLKIKALVRQPDDADPDDADCEYEQL